MTDKESGHPTRESLLVAALHLFGQRGYEAVSTREIATRAQTNVASIAYHFSGKPGLRQACASAVAERIASAFQPVPNATELSQEDAAALIEMIVRAVTGLIVGTPGMQDMVSFVLREAASPGGTADFLYSEIFEPRHIALCGLWAAATGRRAEREEVKLAVFTLFGQILYFRIAQPFVERRLGWTETGAEEAARIGETVVANLRAMLERHRR